MRTVACTPHLRASEVRDGPPQERRAANAALREALGAIVPAVRLVGGFEVMLDEPGVDLARAAVTLGDSRAVLVEFPRAAAPVGADRELARLRANGLVPLVAHPERCGDMSPALASVWRAAGAVLQGDASTLAGDGARARRARALLAAGAYDILASDNHGDDRSLAVVRDLLVSHGAAEPAALLTETNPACLLADQPPHPVPPTQLPDGLWHEVRAWLFHRLGAAAGARGAARPPHPSPDSTR